MDQGLSTAFRAHPNIVTLGGVKAFAGRRVDPFVFDLAAFLGPNGRSFATVSRQRLLNRIRQGGRAPHLT
jgi:hypothetical protein